MVSIPDLFFYRDLSSDKARGGNGKRGRNTRSRTPPVRIPIRKGQKAVNNKNNARAKLFSMPVSPLTKENGGKNKKNNNYEDEAAEESDVTKDEDSDENNTGEAVINIFLIFIKKLFLDFPDVTDFPGFPGNVPNFPYIFRFPDLIFILFLGCVITDLEADRMP